MIKREIRTGNLLRVTQGHNSGIPAIAIKGNIIVGSGEKTIKIWKNNYAGKMIKRATRK